MTIRRGDWGQARRAAAGDLDAERFPALRGFFRGYLHQDWALEHSSAVHAARTFLAVADPEERDAVAAEWRAFRTAVDGQTLAAVRRAVCDILGSAWRPSSLAELDRLGAALTAPSR
ncbi:MAG: contact-dependent growth inhibition system immunity protein [Acidobacteriota bacterium]